MQDQYLVVNESQAEAYAWIDMEKQIAPNRYLILGLYVQPFYRNCGLGTGLMKLMLKDAFRDCVEVWAALTPEDGRKEDLERFYERLGFENTGLYWVWPCRNKPPQN